MFRLLLLASIMVFVGAEFVDWEKFGGPFRNYDKRLFSKKKMSKKSQSNCEYTVCRTRECFKVASEFWESMNKSVDPCENFYEHACGNWPINNPIPPNEMTWSNFRKGQKMVQYKIRDILEESPHSDDILSVKQVKQFYQSCMNVDSIEEIGIQPLEFILSRNGGWPITMESKEWDPKEFSWQQIDNYYSQIMYTFTFYTVEVTKNIKDMFFLMYMSKQKKTRPVIGLNVPVLPLAVMKSPDKQFNRTKMYNDGSYAKFVIEVALIFAEHRGSNVKKEQIIADVMDIIELEKKLSNRSSIPRFQCILMKQVQQIYDRGINHTGTSKLIWEKTLRSLFAEANVLLDDNETVCVDLKYLLELSDILQGTNPRVLVNYIHWNFISQMLPFSTSKMRSLMYELEKIQAGVKEETPRWEFCVENVQMMHAIAYQFVKKNFQDKMETDAEKIFSNIQKQIVKHILKADWIIDQAKKIELEKIKEMRTKIGYPHWYNNTTILNNYYQGVIIGNQLFDNVVSYKRYSFKKMLRSLKNPEKVDEWRLHPLQVGAYYEFFRNSLTVPVSIFQYPFYFTIEPETINYGSLGTVFGHEVSHAFDNTGFKIDKNGNKINFPEFSQAYNIKSLCYVKQFKNFYKNESTGAGFLEMKASRTLGENMADSIGLGTVFDAFEEKVKEQNEIRLPGFEDMSDEQFYFISFAKLWCESSTPKFEELLRNFDPHSQNRYRVISSVQNSEGFSKAFNCPKNSPMNPELKCKFW